MWNMKYVIQCHFGMNIYNNSVLAYSTRNIHSTYFHIRHSIPECICIKFHAFLSFIYCVCTAFLQICNPLLGILNKFIGYKEMLHYIVISHSIVQYICNFKDFTSERRMSNYYNFLS